LESSILERISAGEPHAVDDCLDRYGGLIWSLARKLISDKTEAEDAIQEIFVELWQQAGDFDRRIASETTFITMVARRRLIDRVRRRKAGPQISTKMSESLDNVCSSEFSRVELDDEAEKAASCMKKLTSEQREIITLSIHEGMSQSNISELLSMPLGTVKSYARRALLQLRDCMQRSLVAHPAGARHE
jgi:RNA polymerase sigma factor (sigma-70 family)